MYRYLLQDSVKEGNHLSVQKRTVSRQIGLHWHDYIELELVVDGKGKQQLNDRESSLRRGSLSLLRLTDFHGLSAESELQLYNLSVDEAFLSADLLQQLTLSDALCFHLNEKETQTVERLLVLCMEENAREKADTEYLQHLLACILLRVSRLVPDGQRRIIPGEKNIRSALLYLQMHFRENPGVEKLADIAHYNTGYFSTVFHKEVGITYTAYLNRLKTDYAKTLLASTKLPVTEIRYECGFTSHSNFLRLFRQATGVSPSAYRKQHRNGK